MARTANDRFQNLLRRTFSVMVLTLLYVNAETDGDPAEYDPAETIRLLEQNPQLRSQQVEYDLQWFMRLVTSRVFWITTMYYALTFAQIFFVVAAAVGDRIWIVLRFRRPPQFWWAAKKNGVQIGIFIFLLAPHILNAIA